MAKILLLFSLCLLVVSSSLKYSRSASFNKDDDETENLPRIWFDSQPQIAEIGSTVRIVCGIENKRRYPVMWIKTTDYSDTLLSADSKLLIADERYSLAYRPINSTWHIEIRNVEPNDEGSYTCRVQLLNDKIDISATIRLKLLIPAKILTDSTSSVEVYEDKPIALNCHTEGYPPPLVYWTREDKAVLSSGGRMYPHSLYVIEHTVLADNGTYRCYAYNGVGELPPVTWTAKLTVKRIFD